VRDACRVAASPAIEPEPGSLHELHSDQLNVHRRAMVGLFCGALLSGARSLLPGCIMHMVVFGN